MIGFTPNGVPLSAKVQKSEDDDLDFDKVWDDKLELTSSEVQDAYERYADRFRRS